MSPPAAPNPTPSQGNQAYSGYNATGGIAGYQDPNGTSLTSGINSSSRHPGGSMVLDENGDPVSIDTPATDQVPSDILAMVRHAFALERITPSDQQVRDFANQIWQDDSVQQFYLQYSSLDPASAAAPITQSQLQSAIHSWFFDPTQIRTSEQEQAQKQALTMLGAAGGKLTTAQQQFVRSGGADAGASDIRNIIDDAALKYGVPVALAEAVAYHESGMDPHAVGDNGTSFGLFQLHEGGRLTAYGLTPEQAYDPRTNADVSMQEFAQVLKAHPEYAEQQNWGAWAVAAQRPADGDAYALTVNNLVGDIQNGWTPTPTSGKSPATDVPPSEQKQYAPLFDLYRKYMGRLPTAAELRALEGMTSDQADAYLRSTPSHIAGMSIGQYESVKATADTESQKVFGHEANDSLVQQLFNQGEASPDGVKAFMLSLGMTPGKDVPKNVYNVLYQAALPHSMNYYNQPPHPSDLKAVWEAQGRPGDVAPTDSHQVLDTLPAAPRQLNPDTGHLVGETPQQ